MHRWSLSLLLCFVTCSIGICQIGDGGPPGNKVIKQIGKCTQAQLTPQQAFLGNQRLKQATVLLGTEIRHGLRLAHQQSILLSLLTIGIAAGVDKLILPRYTHHAHLGPDPHAEAPSQDGSPRDLWDTEQIASFLHTKGVGMYNRSYIDDVTTLFLDCTLQNQHWEVADAAHMLRQQVRWHLATAEPAEHYNLHVVLPDLMYSVQSNVSYIYKDSMLAARFSPKVRELAHTVITNISAAGATFNGMHLVLDEDLADNGELESYELMYKNATKGLGKSAQWYVGTGDFASARRGHKGMKKREKRLVKWLRAVFGKNIADTHVMRKELILSEQDLEELTSEQLAAVDCLVLLNAHMYLGVSGSSMSYLVQEYRALLGRPRRTTNMIGSIDANVPYDNLYHEALRVNALS